MDAAAWPRAGRPRQLGAGLRAWGPHVQGVAMRVRGSWPGHRLGPESGAGRVSLCRLAPLSPLWTFTPNRGGPDPSPLEAPRCQASALCRGASSLGASLSLSHSCCESAPGRKAGC